MKLSGFLVILLGCSVASVAGACTRSDHVCEFHLDLSEELTMVHQGTLVKIVHGKLYSQDETTYTNTTEIPLNEVLTADGWPSPRKVSVFNHQMPGPSIEVYEGQIVTVHVTNNMASDTTSLHWYGLEQRHTPWMDGEGYITQCPILPGETFTYKFKADRAGTYWYQSTMGGQTMDGAFGPFIVRSKGSSHSREFIMTVQDWNHDWDSEEMELRREYGWYLNGKHVPERSSPTGSKYSMLRVQTELVNGRGRVNVGNSDAPMTKFEIEQGFDYRFRTIHAGSMLPFRVSIDDHVLTVVALDGVDIVPVTVESFIINPGERVDFIIYGDKAVGNYWIRGEALVTGNSVFFKSVLHYKSGASIEPKSNRKNCTSDDICLILNCPFEEFPSKTNTKCIPVDKLKSLKPNTFRNGGSNFREIFLNFALPGADDRKGSVDGHAFDRFPLSPPLTQGADIPCDSSTCGQDKVCHCPLVLDLNQGTELQLVLTSMGEGRGWDHPIHIHGHHFSVLKTGFGNVNKTTGLFRGDNLDIDCLGNPNRDLNFCNSATWGNPSWLNGNIPDVNLHNPPMKDTVVVPNGGYVVVRLRADNPGLWMMHSAIIPYKRDGLAMLLNESFSAIPTTPMGFPTCGDYNPLYTIPINPIPTSGKIPGKPGIIG